MEPDFGSDYSSECESSWTMYLGHSIYPCDPLQKSANDEEEEDDDISMLSDASSGPPLVHVKECNENGVKEEGSPFHREIQDLPCFLADTFSYVGNGQASVGKGDNFIEDHSEGECEDQFGDFDFSVSGTQLQQDQLRKPWRM